MHISRGQNFYEGLKKDAANPNYMEMLALIEEDHGDLEIAERLYKAAHRITSEVCVRIHARKCDLRPNTPQHPDLYDS